MGSERDRHDHILCVMKRHAEYHEMYLRVKEAVVACDPDEADFVEEVYEGMDRHPDYMGGPRTEEEMYTTLTERVTEERERRVKLALVKMGLLARGIDVCKAPQLVTDHFAQTQGPHSVPQAIHCISLSVWINNVQTELLGQNKVTPLVEEAGKYARKCLDWETGSLWRTRGNKMEEEGKGVDDESEREREGKSLSPTDLTESLVREAISHFVRHEGRRISRFFEFEQYVRDQGVDFITSVDINQFRGRNLPLSLLKRSIEPYRRNGHSVYIQQRLLQDGFSYHDILHVVDMMRLEGSVRESARAAYHEAKQMFDSGEAQEVFQRKAAVRERLVRENRMIELVASRYLSLVNPRGLAEEELFEAVLKAEEKEWNQETAMRQLSRVYSSVWLHPKFIADHFSDRLLRAVRSLSLPTAQGMFSHCVKEIDEIATASLSCLCGIGDLYRFRVTTPDDLCHRCGEAMFPKRNGYEQGEYTMCGVNCCPDALAVSDTELPKDVTFFSHPDGLTTRISLPHKCVGGVFVWIQAVGQVTLVEYPEDD